MIELETLYPHAHYSPQGDRQEHAPGDRYVVRDAPGMSATQYANAMIALGVAKVRAPKKSTPPNKDS